MRGVSCCRVRSVSVIRVRPGAECRNVRGETGTPADPGVPGVPGPRYEGEKGEYGQAARALLPLRAHLAGVEREDVSRVQLRSANKVGRGRCRRRAAMPRPPNGEGKVTRAYVSNPA